MTEIRLYIEGGGTGNDTKTQLRRGFDNLLRPLIDIARDRKIRFRNVTCGSRREAFDDFRSALKTHSASVNTLLVDSEGPVLPDALPNYDRLFTNIEAIIRAA